MNINQRKGLIKTDLFGRVKNAMLSMQRYSWEQGIAAQSLLEAGETETVVAMAYAAASRQIADGRLGVIGNSTEITDPGANGEAVFRSYEITEDQALKTAADKMLEYLMVYAPHSDDGIIYHNEVSSDERFSPYQIWADSCYMTPPFLAVMGELNEATKQIFGIFNYLRDEASGCLFHIFDAGTHKFVRKQLWATGNGWALLGIARVISEAKNCGDFEAYDNLKQTGRELLGRMLKFQCDDGLFYDVLNKTNTFKDGTSAMMCAAFIYRGIKEGWLDKKYKQNADIIRKTMNKKVDDFGIVRGVCGAPEFKSQGISTEAQAAWIMMDTWAKK